MFMPHRHSYDAEWKSDETSHWNECVCGEKSSIATHADADFNEKCDVCDASVPHTHSFGTEWKTDDTNHWTECACGEKNNVATHTDSNFDEKCDVCAANVPHTHSFGTEWKSDNTNHWTECACGEKANSAAHIDLNTDSKCDTCTANMGEPFDVAKFFSETVFLGDSVTMGLRNYCSLYPDALHGAKFLCAGSYAVRHAVGEVGGQYIISITYQGQKMRPEDALAAMGAKRVFIMLGLNDIGISVDLALQNWAILLRNLRNKCPDMEIYIQSGTPILIGGEVGGVNNKNMNRYNTLLEQFCKDNNVNFVNVAEALKDDQGGLKAEYCSDDYCHMTYAGVRVWIDYLKNYVINKHK
jgi:lysophospholipase L1-like esterase